MKIIVNRNNLKENPAQFMRRVGYGFIQDRRRGTESFARRITREHYPRFHVYIKDEGDKIIFDMHLDQKRASYAGAHAHNAEYDGPAVESEIARLKGLLGIQDKKRGTHNVERVAHNSNISDIPSVEEKIGNRNILDNLNSSNKPAKKKGWLRRIFNF